jgi:hypothetical protein
MAAERKIRDGEPYWFFWQAHPPQFRRITLEEVAALPQPDPSSPIHIGRMSYVGNNSRNLDVPHQALCGYEVSRNEGARAQRTHPFGAERECAECASLGKPLFES